jgi:hypothetical protein
MAAQDRRARQILQHRAPAPWKVSRTKEKGHYLILDSGIFIQYIYYKCTSLGQSISTR